MPIDETLPESVKTFLRSGATLESIRLDAIGHWTHVGLDFENPKIIGLFNRSVDRTEGGTWVLSIPPFTYPIEVERTGFFVERCWIQDDALMGVMSDATRELISLDTLTYEPDGKLFCWIKDGRFEARFKKPAYYALVDQFEETAQGVVLNLGQKTQVLIPA